MAELKFGIAAETPCVTTTDCMGTMVFPYDRPREWFRRDPMDTKRLTGYCATCGAEIERWNTSVKYTTLAIWVVG